METKKCLKCGQTKPVDDFYKKDSNKDGYHKKCKRCICDDRKIYQQQNKEKIAKVKQIHRLNHKAEIAKKNKEYRDKNREILSEKKRESYYKNWTFNKKQSRKYYQKNSDRLKQYAKEYRKNNMEKILQYQLSNSENLKQKHYTYLRSPAIYTTHMNSLTIDEAPRLADNGLYIEIKCSYCGKYYIPTNREIQNRTQALLGNLSSESRCYCSKHCKAACPIFGKVKYPKGFKLATSREVQPELRQLTLARDNYTCQKCGKTIEEVQLHCHHILPINESPVESADVSNCITLCKECHQHAHAIPDCGYHDLKCSV